MTTETTELAPSGAGPGRGTALDIATTRAAQEVQAAMVIAKRFPRDENEAFARVKRACSRKALAEVAVYEYPRGGQTVTGPSIRLAEALAQNWGNIDFGVIELEQKHGESSLMAYAWDLETNTRVTKVFTVKHERHKKGGVVDRLTDPRDIYEMTANQGARRMRACILGVIPGDVTEQATQWCEDSLRSGATEPLADRVRKMAAAFGEVGVTVAQIEARLGHNLSATTETEMAKLRRIFTSIKDGASGPRDWFGDGRAETPAAGAKTMDDLKKGLDAALDKKPTQSAPSGEPTEDEKRRIRERELAESSQD